MAEKLIFSFCNGFDVAFEYQHLAAAGGLIRFGAGFEDADMILNGITYTEVDPQIVDKMKPVIEFTSGCGVNTLSSEMKEEAVEASSPAISPKPFVFTPITYSEQNTVELRQKEVMTDVKTELPLALPSKFEVGSSSSAPLTKTQRRNKNRRLKKRNDKEAASAELKEIEAARASGEFILPETSPLLGGSRFHPLFAAKGEENIKKIASSPPRPFEVVEEKRTTVEHKKRLLKSILVRAAAEVGATRADVLTTMKEMIDKHVQEKLRKENLPPKKGKLMSTSFNKRDRFQIDEVVSRSVKRSPPRQSVWERLSLKDEQLDNKLNKTRRLSKLNESSRSCRRLPAVGHSSSLRIDDKQLSHQFRPMSSSSERMAWRPKSAVPSHEHRRETESTKVKGKKKIHKSIYEEYVPMDPHYVEGKSVNDIMDEMRASLQLLAQKREEEQRSREADESFDLDSDDFMSK